MSEDEQQDVYDEGANSNAWRSLDGVLNGYAAKSGRAWTQCWNQNLPKQLSAVVTSM